MGRVKISIEPDDPRAGLFPEKAEVPGKFYWFTGGNAMGYEKVNSGFVKPLELLYQDQYPEDCVITIIGRLHDR